MQTNDSKTLSFSERIDSIVKYFGLKSKRQLALKIDILPQTLGLAYRGDREPSLQIVEALLKEFQDLNARWLIFGTGVMIETNDSKNTISHIDRIEQMLNGKISTLESRLKAYGDRIEGLEKIIYPNPDA